MPSINADRLLLVHIFSWRSSGSVTEADGGSARIPNFAR